VKKIWIADAVLLIPALVAAKPPEHQQPGLLIREYNLARISESDMRKAHTIVVHTFHQVGIAINFKEGDSSAAEGLATDMSAPIRAMSPAHPDYVVIRIVTDRQTGMPAGPLGFALPFARLGAQATIFSERVERLAAVESLSPVVLLGYAIAHEIGHVLLRSSNHSATGIMRPVWTRSDFHWMICGAFDFNAADSIAIRSILQTELVSSGKSSR
jgi:hypothetical protein